MSDLSDLSDKSAASKVKLHKRRRDLFRYQKIKLFDFILILCEKF